MRRRVCRKVLRYDKTFAGEDGTSGTPEVQEKPQTITDRNVSQKFVCLHNKPFDFCAGKISRFFQNWTNLTQDQLILNIVKEGYDIEFESEPCALCNRKPINFHTKEQHIISELLKKFEDKGIIVESEHEPGEILSNIFIRPKQDGKYRLILNLSRLNEHVDKITFKMETLRSALQMIQKGWFFFSEKLILPMHYIVS